jgi:hypothetical protein
MQLTVNLPAGLGEELQQVAKKVYGDSPTAVDQLVSASLIPVLHNDGLLKFQPSGGQDLTVSQVPGWLMTEFVEAAKRVRPDAGDQAWMHLLLDAMISFVEADKSVLMLTDIPRDSFMALEDVLGEVGADVEGFIGQMFIEAGLGTLLTSTITTEPPDVKKNFTIIIRNVPNRSLAVIHQLAKQLNASLPKEAQVEEGEIAPHHFLAMQLAMFAHEDANAFIKVEDEFRKQQQVRRSTVQRRRDAGGSDAANGNGESK